ncbi:MAG: pyrroloquinoline quinone biosynthesis protein C [Legionellales bacterium]|nr:pyrroloquinoline quinone biosynthesis protein C [Legionellales bacterium]|tara:strand:- start:572 stop:1297 length:726 start_codon:yes stop_codon:yes gene_type:complete
MTTSNKPWSREEFEKKLRSKEMYYHINHDFHILMNEGGLDKEAVQGWVANRFYYQTTIPIKDAAIMSNCTDRNARRQWVQRIIDHDGVEGDDGGIEAWLQLAEAVGLSREETLSYEHVLPGVRFAIDAYLNFARRATWEEAASSSLTELFAPKIHQKRLDNWPDLYPWIDAKGYQYFRKRLKEARRDVQHGLDITLEYYKTRAEQEYALSVLQFKLDILWTMLDCMWMAYIEKKPPFYNCT